MTQIKIQLIPTSVNKVDEPIKDYCTGVGDVEVCQKAEAGTCGSSKVGDTRLGAACETSGDVSDQRH